MHRQSPRDAVLTSAPSLGNGRRETAGYIQKIIKVERSAGIYTTERNEYTTQNEPHTNPSEGFQALMKHETFIIILHLQTSVKTNTRSCEILLKLERLNIKDTNLTYYCNFLR